MIDWDYLNAAETKKVPTWKVFVPSNALVAGYYFQAIKDGPHPAAARLWQEFLYSDEGQEPVPQGSRPTGARRRDGKGRHRRRRPLKALPAVKGEPVVPTDAQSKKIGRSRANWSKVIS